MLNYEGELYAKFGRKYIPTGRTAAEWDNMEKSLRDLIQATGDYMKKNKFQPACIQEGLNFPDGFTVKVMPEECELMRIKSALDKARIALGTEEGK